MVLILLSRVEISETASMNEEIAARVVKGNRAMEAKHRILRNIIVLQNAKVRLYQTVLRPPIMPPKKRTLTRAQSIVGKVR